MPKRSVLCSGVYKIVNTANSKIYVGSATTSFKTGWDKHKSDLKNGVHDNDYLQKSWNKHGKEAFRFKIIEKCESDKCLNREQYWLDCLRPYDRGIGYNISLQAGNVMGGRSHPKKSRKKMSLKRKGKIPHKATAAAAKVNKGKKRSQEVKDKISKAQKGKPRPLQNRINAAANHWRNRDDWKEITQRSAAKNRGKKHSEEHKRKIAASMEAVWEKRRRESSQLLNEITPT